MNRSWNRSWWFSLAAALLLLIQGCGGTGSSSTPPQGAGGTVVTGGGGGGGGAGTTVVTITATPTTIPANGTAVSSISATVTFGGAAVAGATVAFSLDSSPVGALSSPSAVTNASGVASVTYTAGVVTGSDIITATSGGAGDTVTVTLGTPPPPAGGIQFISATPNIIGIAGGGQITTSTVTFRATTATGTPAAAESVVFNLSGPNGGEYIGTPGDGSPSVDIGTTDNNGNVSVILNSGTVAGPVTISATVSATSSTAASSVISIGGGIPSANHFDLLVSRKNLPGLVRGNFPTTFTALLADRFGNFNVLAGTSVSFYTEAGAIDASNVVDSTGATTVTFRTQAPNPANVALSNTNPPIDEGALQARLLVDYGLNTTAHPRDGWVTVLATVRGEETFIDTDGDGIYTAGADIFIPALHDLGEPFIDEDDDGIHDATEFYVDDNNNGVYNGPNGVWDGPGCTQAGCVNNKLIWRSHTIMFTGNVQHCRLDAANFTGVNQIPNAGSRTFNFMVSDANLNAPVPGTIVSAALNGAGTFLGQSSYTVPDMAGGPYEVAFVVTDNDIENPEVDAPAFTTLTVTVTTPAGEILTCTQRAIVGEIN